MKKIGICFPENDFFTLNFEEFKNNILLFKNNGLYSFDIYTSLLLNDHKNVDQLLSFLNDNNIKVTFHYDGNNLYGKSLDDINSQIICDQYKNDLIKLRNKLQEGDIFYRTSIVFHALNYDEEYQKYNHLNHQINIFKEICELGDSLKFDILVETLSYNHPIGNHLGDDYNELEEMINRVGSDNFGICWDIGHTRLNYLEEYSDKYLPLSIMKKVRFTHIHNHSANDGIHEVIDHLPLTNKIYQEELRYLLDNKYKGIYAIEMDTNQLQENIMIYIESIKIMKSMLEEEEQNGTSNNG